MYMRSALGAVRLILMAACVLYVASCFGQAVSVELKEDFSGSGDTQIDSDFYGMEDHVSAQDADRLVYGHSWVEGNSFSGLRAAGKEIGYSVTDSAHSLAIRQASNLNVTAKMEAQVEEEGNKTMLSSFQASGNGTVRELAQQEGRFNRPVDLASLWHTGPFRLNSTMKVVA